MQGFNITIYDLIFGLSLAGREHLLVELAGEPGLSDDTIYKTSQPLDGFLFFEFLLGYYCISVGGLHPLICGVREHSQPKMHASFARQDRRANHKCFPSLLIPLGPMSPPNLLYLLGLYYFFNAF